MPSLLLVIIHNLDVVCSVGLPDKANAPLVVDPNAVLSFAIALQRLQSVAWRYAQRIDPRRGVELRELAPRHDVQALRQPPHELAGEYAGCVPVREGFDHQPILTPLVIIGKRRRETCLPPV